MVNFHKKILLVSIFIIGAYQVGNAQDVSFDQNINPGIIKIAATGQLADTLNLWGDVRSTGKYLVPRKTNLTDLISYARGPVGITGGETWSKVNLDIYISRYNPQSNQYMNESFNLKLNEPLPQEMKNYPLRNGDVITVKADRKPTFRDYFSIIAPVLSLGLSTFLVLDRL
jgi:hypothetical protein